jgi:putative oxidoreductase
MARKARLPTIALWALSLLLAALFLMSGSGKLTNADSSGGVPFDEQFVLWGYPAWFRIPVGLAEVAGAIAPLVPRVRFYAAAGLTLLMLGATATHLWSDEAMYAPIPLVLAVLAATVAWLSRPSWVQARLGRSGTQVA